MNGRPVLLDLFCGAGGAAMGYHQAGFEVVGVDIDPQPHYPFRFVKGDALDVLAGWDLLPDLAAIHASPPCQDHTSLTFTRQGEAHGTGWMLDATIRALRKTGHPFVVENVPGADLPGAFTLCGRSFGIRRLRRHRLFLTSFPVPLVPPCACDHVQPIGVYGDLSKNDRKITSSTDGYVRRRAGGPDRPRPPRLPLDGRQGTDPGHPARVHRVHRRAVTCPPRRGDRVTRRTARRRPHLFVVDPGVTNWRGDDLCAEVGCGQLAAAAVHDLPDNPAADEEARRLGEHPEREDYAF